ncbi:hypothetical protein, partial [Anoxynatronum sibiricum]
SSTVNQAITLRASSNPPGAEFEFWVRPPGQSWRVVRAYGPSSSFSYTPSVTGSWQVGVRGRMPGSTQWVDHIRDHQVSSASITSV